MSSMLEESTPLADLPAVRVRHDAITFINHCDLATGRTVMGVVIDLPCALELSGAGTPCSMDASGVLGMAIALEQSHRGTATLRDGRPRLKDATCGNGHRTVIPMHRSVRDDRRSFAITPADSGSFHDGERCSQLRITPQWYRYEEGDLSLQETNDLMAVLRELTAMIVGYLRHLLRKPAHQQLAEAG